MTSAQTVINTIKGHKWDVDGTDDFDCVDVAKKADRMYHPGTTWGQTGIHGDGKEIFGNANPKYYKKIVNDHSNPNQLPKMGDIICYDATPKAGYTNKYDNPWGHVALVVDPDNNGKLTILMQASGTGKAAHYDTHSWRYRPVQGWLRPISPTSPTELLKATIKGLKSTVASLKDKLAGRETNEALLKRKITAQDKTINQLQTDFNAKKQELDAELDRNADLVIENTGLKDRVTELGRIHISDEKEIDRLNAKLAACGQAEKRITAQQAVRVLIELFKGWLNK